MDQHSWEPGNFNEVNKLGKRLSIEIRCPVTFPAYDKNAFRCKCGVFFPVFMLRGGDWTAVKRKHEEEGRDG